MECYCFLRCVSDALAPDNRTAYWRRFEADFRGEIIPFGAEIEYKPSYEKDLDRLHKMGKKMLPGIFLGYEQRAGGGWTGNFFVVDWNELENAEHVSEVHKKTIDAREVDVIKRPARQGELRSACTQTYSKVMVDKSPH